MNHDPSGGRIAVGVTACHGTGVVPDELILVETDAPFLAPPPYRGKRNEPAHVVHTARAGAALFGMTEAEFAARTSANFDRLFTKAARQRAAA